MLWVRNDFDIVHSIITISWGGWLDGPAKVLCIQFCLVLPLNGAIDRCEVPNWPETKSGSGWEKQKLKSIGESPLESLLRILNDNIPKIIKTHPLRCLGKPGKKRPTWRTVATGLSEFWSRRHDGDPDGQLYLKTMVSGIPGAGRKHFGLRFSFRTKTKNIYFIKPPHPQKKKTGTP